MNYDEFLKLFKKKYDDANSELPPDVVINADMFEKFWNKPGVLGSGASLISWNLSPSLLYSQSLSRSAPKVSTDTDTIKAGIVGIIDSRMDENMRGLQTMIQSMVRNEVEKKLSQTTIHEIEEFVVDENLSKDVVKEKILAETRIGDEFYPSDLANKFGLDLKTVVEVIAELKLEGKISEKQE